MAILVVSVMAISWLIGEGWRFVVFSGFTVLAMYLGMWLSSFVPLDF
jgi:hypothetical protein